MQDTGQLEAKSLRRARISAYGRRSIHPIDRENSCSQTSLNTSQSHALLREIETLQGIEAVGCARPRYWMCWARQRACAYGRYSIWRMPRKRISALVKPASALRTHLLITASHALAAQGIQPRWLFAITIFGKKLCKASARQPGSMNRSFKVCK